MASLLGAGSCVGGTVAGKDPICLSNSAPPSFLPALSGDKSLRAALCPMAKEGPCRQACFAVYCSGLVLVSSFNPSETAGPLGQYRRNHLGRICTHLAGRRVPPRGRASRKPGAGLVGCRISPPLSTHPGDGG